MPTRRSFIGGIGALLAGNGIGLSGAFSSTNTERAAAVRVVDDSGGTIGIEENENYVGTYIEADSVVLEITLENLNDRSKTTIDELFYVTNNADTTYTASIDDSDLDSSVSFTFANGDGQSTVLSPGERAAVNAEVNLIGSGQTGEGSLRISAM